MAVNSRSLLLVLTLLVAMSTLFDVSIALGGRKAMDFDTKFKPLYPKDPKVVKVAKYAIDEYNKEAEIDLKFDHVFQAASQGTIYNLIIKASNGSILDKYDAVVSLNGDSKTLVAFKKQ